MSKTIVGLNNDRLLDSNYIVDNSAILSKKINGVVLYENADGSNETITLSESVTNGTYSLLRIDFNTNDGYHYSKMQAVGTSSFNTGLIGDAVVTDGTTYLKFRDININGTTIATRGNTRYSEVKIATDGTVSLGNVNNIYITKVTAYI